MLAETPKRQFEGPPELLYENVLERDINDRRGMPGGKSPADRLTKQYGERGVGWDIAKERYTDQNQLKDELHAPEFQLATEGMRNYFAGSGYKTDDGIELTGKVQRYVRESDTVDVVVYPDGKAHAAQEKE